VPHIAKNVLLALALGVFQGSAWAQTPLPALGARADSVTVSGLSSGAFMAVQFHVAHSSQVSGAGVLAGGPYYCAMGTMMLTAACMSPSSSLPVPPLRDMVSEARKQAREQAIDNLDNLARSRLWLLSGGRDGTVKTAVVDQTYDFYRNWVPASAIEYERIADAGHAMLSATAKDANDCAVTGTPFINRCGDFDAPGRLLAHLLGTLNPPADTHDAALLAFDQHAFTTGTDSMDRTAYVYVPAACREGGCRVHIAFHGCMQQAETIGTVFVREAGYNRWAESNKLIVLYPQTIKNRQINPTKTNPYGCWDWWGYTGPNYHTQAGAQIRAVKAMLDRLTSKP
jgi:poly(3-hydroxybutyrate) depolymerase